MNAIVCGYGEIHLKGSNRGFFLRKLEKNIKRVLPNDLTVIVEDARVIITEYKNEEEIILLLKKVFGLTTIRVTSQINYVSPNDILEYVSQIKLNGSFKVDVNRANKKFEIKSPEFCAMCGDKILKNNEDAVVDVHNPKTIVQLDIRNNGIAFVSTRLERGLGGLPVGVSGRALCLISGGIDSPVAAFLALKRGLSVDFVHFSTPPYTSDKALEKVEMLCKKVCEYGCESKLYVVPFTKIGTEIQRSCHEEYIITLMRRFMIAIAEKIGIENGADCIITGENLAQVASQTIQGIASNNFIVKKLPILRPLICFDKEEIITIARHINTYQTSILPYQDCCTVFVPSHPSIKPRMDDVLNEENKLDFDSLVNKAYNEVLCKKLLDTSVR